MSETFRPSAEAQPEEMSDAEKMKVNLAVLKMTTDPKMAEQLKKAFDVGYTELYEQEKERAEKFYALPFTEELFALYGRASDEDKAKIEIWVDENIQGKDALGLLFYDEAGFNAKLRPDNIYELRKNLKEKKEG